MFARLKRPRTKARVAELELRIAQLEAVLAETQQSILKSYATSLVGHGEALLGHGTRLLAAEQRLGDIDAAFTTQLAAQATTLSAHATWFSTHATQLSDIDSRLAATTQAIAAMRGETRMVQIWTVMRWLAAAPATSDVLISVIMPTRNRRQYLERAIASIRAQTHANFELVIIDDGCTDSTPELLDAIDDPRLRRLSTTGLGAGAARNLGLDAASGAIITHFDDDNLMDPNWLRSVAWGFSRWPETEVLYGARIIEDPAAHNRIPSGAMPMLEWQQFDRAKLEKFNTIDMNVIAHRAGLPEARFDLTLPSCIDWDLILRLTANSVPLELPALACLYSNYAPNRMGDRPNREQEIQFMRARVHTTRPMRVLSYNSLFPLLSETYIEEEMLALEAAGAQIAFVSVEQSVAPYPLRHKLYATLDAAAAAHDPDILVLHWATHAIGVLDDITRIGRPFALRVHSFDFSIENIARVASHPFCVGIWAYPHQVELLTGAHALAPILMTHAAIPDCASRRTIVASVSACLPKKDWPLLLDAMDQLPEFERLIVVARTNGFEDLPDQISGLAAALPNPVAVKINLPRQEVFDLLSRTAVMLYTVAPDTLLGMPMSIVEALRAGACVVTPDAPEMQAICGAGYRPYHNAADIVTHVRDVMAGGDRIDNERKTNREWALQQFCDPARAQIFHDELSAALTAWRIRQNV